MQTTYEYLPYYSITCTHALERNLFLSSSTIRNNVIFNIYFNTSFCMIFDLSIPFSFIAIQLLICE